MEWRSIYLSGINASNVVAVFTDETYVITVTYDFNGKLKSISLEYERE